MKTKLHLAPVNGGPFNCLPARAVELDDCDILANDVTLPGDFNPHSTRLWVIGHEFGALVAVWANHEQDAFDTAVDENKLDCLQVTEGDAEEMGEDCTHLGNAGEPFDLTNAWIQCVAFEPARDWRLLCRFAEARGNGSTSLYF